MFAIGNVFSSSLSTSVQYDADLHFIPKIGVSLGGRPRCVVSAPRRSALSKTTGDVLRHCRLCQNEPKYRLYAAMAGETEAQIHSDTESKDPVDEESLFKDFGLLSEKLEELATEVIAKLEGTSIYLVGMMGSGKSTLGKLLAGCLRYCFFDTDTLIEKLAKKSVAEIFAEDGEEEFREVETQIMQELAPFRSLVVSTGGGAVLRGHNWGHMQQGVVVWLDAHPELLAARLRDEGLSTRPLLAMGQEEEQGEGEAAVLARLGDLLAERRGLYAQADVHVSVAGAGGERHMGAPSAVVAYRVLKGIRDRVARDAEERQQRQEFSITGAHDVPNLLHMNAGANPSLDIALPASDQHKIEEQAELKEE